LKVKSWEVPPPDFSPDLKKIPVTIAQDFNPGIKEEKGMNRWIATRFKKSKIDFSDTPYLKNCKSTLGLSDIL
jgi:hypothetical protein